MKATEKQKALMNKLSIKYSDKTTVSGASVLISAKLNELRSYRNKTSNAFSVKDEHRRLHGAQPVFGSGEVIYDHGTLEYMDDGNGNVFENDYDRLDDCMYDASYDGWND